MPRTQGGQLAKTKSGDVLVNNLGAHDKLPEVSSRSSRFNVPGQMLLRHPSGVEEMIYDCVQQARPCAPLDPMPSLDGKKIAFAVYSADNTVNAFYSGVTFPNKHLGTKNTRSTIYIYNVESKTLTQWPQIGQHDAAPVWQPDGRIMFTSDLDGQWRPWLNRITPKAIKDTRLFTANEDGSDVKDVSPHAHGGVLHPYVLANGRTVVSSLWQNHNLAYITTNGGINWPGTLDNMWVLEDVDREGGDSTTLLGGHKNTIRDSKGRTKTMKALHFVSQRWNSTKDILTANYYRANNLGLGDVFGFPPQPVGMEGPSPSFLPTGVYNVADWSKSNDTQAYPGQAKIGYPEGIPGGQIILAVGQGICTQFGSNVSVLNGLTDQIGCDVGLRVTTTIPSKVIGDTVLIVDSPLWHEFGARAVVARDVDMPALSKTSDGSCELASSDAGSTDAHNYKSYKFNKNYRAMANNGGEIQGLDHSELYAIRFYEVLPNLTKAKEKRPRNHMGNNLRRLGEDVPLLADKSFSVKLPCDTSYLMAGVDKQGLVIKRDQLPQSLRPGEKRVCGGCHLHGEKGRPYEQSLAFSTDALDRMVSRPVPTYEADIKPIFQDKCVGCHAQDSFLMDYEKLVWDYFQKHVYQGNAVEVSRGLHRPYTSKYVNNMFARESLLYWKAANKRTDGRTDQTYDDDIDFGKDHPTLITVDELKSLGNWLDSGAAR